MTSELFTFEDSTARVFVNEDDEQSLPRYLCSYMQAGIKHTDDLTIRTEKARFWQSRPKDQKPPPPF